MMEHVSWDGPQKKEKLDHTLAQKIAQRGVVLLWWCGVIVVVF